MEVLHYNLDMTPESEWKIVSAGAFARDNLLYLQEAGHFISGANYYTVRKNLDSYLVKLTLSGAGILEYGGETYRLPAGSRSSDGSTENTSCSPPGKPSVSSWLRPQLTATRSFSFST